MKVAILAGGFGTSLSELTSDIPKPMVMIGGKPILWHIMNYYSKYGHNDFYIALGYKSEVVKNYFLNYSSLNSDFTVCMKTGEITCHNSVEQDWKVTLIDTGANSMTGGRVKRLQKYIGDETFLLTYGDGLCDVDISELISFHQNNKKMVTVTTVHPGARFGELELKGDSVISFKEKPQTKQGWINGGYFVVEPSFFNLIDDDSTILEKEPLEEAARTMQLNAFKHEGFWQCMDTLRDKNFLESLVQSGEAPWLLQK